MTAPSALNPFENELLGAQALHFFVDDGGQGDLAGDGLPGVLQGHQGPGHGGQGAFHVHGPPSVETAVLFDGGERVFRVSRVGRDRVHMAAEEKVRTGPSLPHRSQKVRPSLADLLIDRLDAAGLKESPDLSCDGLLLARHSRIGWRPDEPDKKLPDIRVGRKVRPEGLQGLGHDMPLLFL